MAVLDHDPPSRDRHGAGKDLCTTTSNRPDVSRIKVSLSDKTLNDIERLVEQGDFLDRERAVEDLLERGISAYNVTEEEEEPAPGEDMFGMTDEQQDPAMQDDGDYY